MALTTSTITGRVPLPTDEVLQYAELTFALSGLDTQGADVLPGGIIKRVTLVNSELPAGFKLWRNTSGLRGTHYRVLVRWKVKDRDGIRDQYADLGIVQVGADASYTLAALLNYAVPSAPASFWSSITQAEYDAVMQARDDAAASAVAAALYDGPRFGTIALMQAGTGFADGKFVRVDTGANGEQEGFVYDAASTLTADGALIVDATGMGVGRLISTRTVFNDQSELDNDVRDHDEGIYIHVRGRKVYVVAPTSALDHHVLLASGVKLYVVRDYSARSSAAHFWKRVRGESADAYVFIGSDSTGNGSTEWPYLWAEWLVTQAPTHTVKLRFWNDGTGSWDAYVTLGSGTGTNTIYIDVCAVGGANSYYLQGGREPAIFKRSDYILAILNYGHNLGTDGREVTTFHDCLIAAAHIHWRCPYASIVVTSQNPRSSENGLQQSKGLGAAWRKVADLTGAGLIDAQAWFFDRSDWVAALMLDETHPNDAGSKIWLAAVQSALHEPQHTDMSESRSAGIPSLSIVGQNLLDNGIFHNWTAGAYPAGWTPTNCTIAKEPSRSEIAKYSMGVTAGASACSIAQSLSLGKLDGVRGRCVLFLSRIWKSSGMSNLAGRINITSSNNVTSVFGTSRSVGDVSADGWAWVLTSVNVQPDAKTLTATIYAGDATDNGKKLWVQSAALFSAAVPLATSFDRIEDMVIDEYYSPLNVHPKSGSDNGTLTADATSLTLTGATDGASTNTIIELPPLDAGATYRFSFDVEPSAFGVGGVYARGAAGGEGSTLASHAGWVQGNTGYTLDFTPTTNIASIWIYASSIATGYEFTSITIKKL